MKSKAQQLKAKREENLKKFINLYSIPIPETNVSNETENIIIKLKASGRL